MKFDDWKQQYPYTYGMTNEILQRCCRVDILSIWFFRFWRLFDIFDHISAPHQRKVAPGDWIYSLKNMWGVGVLNSVSLVIIHTLGGGFEYFLFLPLFGEDFQFDQYFSDGLKPPTSTAGKDDLFWPLDWCPGVMSPPGSQSFTSFLYTSSRTTRCGVKFFFGKKQPPLTLAGWV